MSIESVRNYFIERTHQDPVFELDDVSATVDQAASAIGVEPKLIAKTLAFRLKEKDILIVVRGDAKINNKKYKEAFNTKAKMLDLSEVEEITGHPVGGVCPFGLKNPLDIYLDISLQNFEYVYPAAGAINAALKITPSDMQSITSAQWVDVCQ
ncbi:YbaK/EbsC family protein [Clostridium sp. CX1]|uniref:YbaK/EbsC family protein n=1 Tax=Clostridium sp. CX1 TaxID=2978346 RepID=UPI0021BFDA4A|nr:YbaK/EbsC family protein [Clostridium sp. CX1]MCT8975382.1 YbaK/EbsC family protein [Clostridium sp. CX1]